MRIMHRCLGGVGSVWWVAALLAVSAVLVAPGAVGQGEGPAENVILVTYDGLRWQELFGGLDAQMLEKDAGVTKNIPAVRKRFGGETRVERREKLLPFFWGTVAKQGRVYGDVMQESRVRSTNGMFFSYPGYNEILTGFADPVINSNAKRPNRNVTVLEWLTKQRGFRGKVAAFCSWDVFPYIINEDRSGVPVNAGWEPLEMGAAQTRKMLNAMADEMPHYWSNVRYDYFTFRGAEDYLRNRRPRVLYVGFGETDDWAHDGRYDLYLDAAHRTDRYIAQLWETVQSMPEYRDKTALILTTDHGRGDDPKGWHGHGDDIPGSEDIWVAYMGPGVEDVDVKRGPGHIELDPEFGQDQVAATVAVLLGLDYRKDVKKAGKPLPLTKVRVTGFTPREN